MFHFNKVLCLSVFVLVINQSTQSPVKPQESQSVDLNVDFSCITNASCVTNVSNKVVRALSSKKVIDFGAFSIEPVMNAKKTEGRSMSKLWELTNSNSLRVPIGSYSLTLQKSQDYDNYFEVSVSKTVEGRGRLHDRKQMQFFVPAFLVASQVGWWMLALAGVSLLAIKAFLVSKLALAIGAIMTVKKIFEHHQGLPHFYEHHEPLMVPYNFDMTAFGGGSGFGNDFHPSLPIGHEQTAALHANGALGAETNNVVTNITGASAAASPGLSAYATVARHPPLNFNYLGKNPFLYRKP